MYVPKKYAKELAERISSSDLQIMLENAKVGVKDWKVASRANKGISRGGNWNMFCKDFNPVLEYAPILKYRMIEEFGEFLPNHLKPEPKEKIPTNPTTHQDPIF